jgi:23S rRNA (adenine2503-C2)-methyltransferase
LKVTDRRGDPDLATVYIARLDDGELVEFVESVQPPLPREEKWVLIVSTLRGCPVRCPICDAGTSYRGMLSAEEILWQIDRMVADRYPERCVPVPKFKIQFARMGDPAFNPAVLEVLRELPFLYDAPGLLPSISTIAPSGCGEFLEKLISVKDDLYSGGRFQMQFSIHSTSAEARRRLVPCRTLNLSEMAEWGSRFRRRDDRKIALNFAAVRGFPVDPGAVAGHFSPEHFMIKLTPVNPTRASSANGLVGVIDPDRPGTAEGLVRSFEAEGFDVVLSIGETRENQIGSNCGMYVGAASGQQKAERPATVP